MNDKLHNALHRQLQNELHHEVSSAINSVLNNAPNSTLHSKRPHTKATYFHDGLHEVEITNATIWTIDWAQKERAAFLQSIPREPVLAPATNPQHTALQQSMASMSAIAIVFRMGVTRIWQAVRSALHYQASPDLINSGHTQPTRLQWNKQPTQDVPGEQP